MSEEKQHALLSASSSARWLLCPASVMLAKDIPDEASPYAEEGTRAHALAENMINAIVAGDDKALADERAKAEREMLAYVDEYINELELLGDKPLREYDHVETEVRLPLGSLTGEKDAYGTADCLIVNGETLWVCDLKYGMGVKVEAENNTQLLMYADAAFDYLSYCYDVKRVNVCIVQPRLHAVSTWAIDPKKTLPLYRRLRESARRAIELVKSPDLAEDKDYCPGEETCRFCRAKLKCAAMTRKLQEDVIGELDAATAERALADRNVVLPVPEDPERLAKAYGLIPVLRYWMEAVEAAAMDHAQSGHYLPGLKLVEGRAGNRKWTDETALLDLLHELAPEAKLEDFQESKLLTPARMEKRLKELGCGPDAVSRLGEVVTRSAPKLVLVPECDKREAVEPLKFEVLE